MEEYLANFLMNSAAKAQQDATTNARQSGKRPVVERTEHSDACKWCQSKTGTYTDPSSDVFARHGGCEGRIITKGYKSRNGLLGNYKAGTAPTRTAPTTGAVDGKGNQVVFRGTGGAPAGRANMFGNALYVARDQTTASQFGDVAQLSMPIKASDILLVATDNQLDKLQLDAQRWAVRTGFSLDPNDYLPAYVLNLGYKAVEVKATVDPLAGIAIIDPKIIKRMTQ